jgi:hypothetical protein
MAHPTLLLCDCGEPQDAKRPNEGVYVGDDGASEFVCGGCWLREQYAKNEPGVPDANIQEGC